MSAPVYAAPVPPPPQPGLPSRVAIVDVNMPFGSMVVFIIKWALASVPAALILIVIFGVLYAILRAIFLH